MKWEDLSNMPPKQHLGRKRTKTQPSPRTQRIKSSTKNKSVVHSTVLKSIKANSESSLDSHSIPSTADLLPINTNDRHYVRVSKQILQYELKTKRITFTPISEQADLENSENSLPASITLDWRLVLQDSLTINDLRQGYLSLFDQVNTGMKLNPIEVNHAVRFLEYTGMHIERRRGRDYLLMETIFPEEKDKQTKLISSLINLLSLPSDTLRTAALSFFDVGLRKSSVHFTVAVAATGLVPKLFFVLKPHEIPFCDTTMEFHRHLTSIVDKFLCFSPKNIRSHLILDKANSRNRKRVPKVVEPMFRSICTYLKSLVDTSDCHSDHRSGFTLLSNMIQLRPESIIKLSSSSSSEIRRFFGEIRRKMMEEVVSLLGLASLKEAEQSLYTFCEAELDPHTDQISPIAALSWLKAFECLIGRVSEGRTISDLGVKAVMEFVCRSPCNAKLFSWADDKFGLQVRGRTITSSKLDSKALWTLFTPTQPHHAATILNGFYWFISYSFELPFMKHIWNGWFPSFTNAVDPSKLPFTSEFIPLHTKLIHLLNYILTTIGYYDHWAKSMTDELRSELDEIYLAFYSHTKDYIIHLSLHPFALDSDDKDTILDFLVQLFQSGHDKSLDKPYREELRKEMDESALSSPSPPFILTSELVFRLTAIEIMNIVDRIVALLESNSPLDDDTILRIFAFHRNVLNHIYLPRLFRQAGRTTDQYLRTLESLLSLRFDFFDRALFDCLLHTRPGTLQPTFDEWDDVDLETVGISMRMINQTAPSLASVSDRLKGFVLNFAFRSLSQTCHCAIRLHRPHLERLLAPSIDIISQYFLQPRDFEMTESRERDIIFFNFCVLCDERVIAQCFSKTGFFSHIVTRLFNYDFNTSEYILHIFIEHRVYCDRPIEDQKMIRRTIPNFLEEGWQDALEFIFVKGNGIDRADIQFKTEKMIRFFGANFCGLQR
ncbi:hypothetical protein BLNAU_6330 [Blattamonas nauphoetae]|uniref:Uncharacterized protein n=1 Tax=Blattamonas nauphoetae TaxID=2049346 RepID=A0ABQ9Y500_9EUKA|nr:hypothetical protein BLNAU_6330 [Blattamonas nauphoetae]